MSPLRHLSPTLRVTSSATLAEYKQPNANHEERTGPVAPKPNSLTRSRPTPGLLDVWLGDVLGAATEQGDLGADRVKGGFGGASHLASRLPPVTFASTRLGTGEALSNRRSEGESRFPAREYRTEDVGRSRSDGYD